MTWLSLMSAIPPNSKRQIHLQNLVQGKTDLNIGLVKPILKAKSRDFYKLFIEQIFQETSSQKHYDD